MVNNLVKISMCFLSFLLVLNIFGTGIAQAQSLSNTDMSLSEYNTIKLLGIDPIAYPVIKVNIYLRR